MRRLMLVPLLCCAAGARAAAVLPEPAALELKRLEETWRVLDFAAEKVWPGWTGYRNVPFLFEFENGLRVLVGHPNPPKPFQPVPDVKVEDRAVYADWSALNPKPLTGPLVVGGGIIPFGADSSGNQVQIAHMRLRQAKDTAGSLAEQQISVYLHELFHCFQRERLRGHPYGNLRYNADVNFAVYSEVEGLALARAFAEPDAAISREYLRDFLAARRRKRAGSMTGQQQNQEGWEEFSEGTATYAQVRTCEILKAGGFQPGLKGDTGYQGFAAAETLIGEFAARLKQAAGRTETGGKTYDYGCFEALLLERHFPGWQQSVPKQVEFLDREIARRLAVPEEAWPKLEQRLEERYPWAEIQGRHAPAIAARDEVWRKLRGRAGRVYVIDCKKTGQYLSGLKPRGKPQRMGLVAMYPEGFETFRFDEVEIGGAAVPAETDQLYYIRVVDPEPPPAASAYTVEGARQPDGTWKNAMVRTPLFTVAAPRIRVLEAENLVKIQVLARVKE